MNFKEEGFSGALMTRASHRREMTTACSTTQEIMIQTWIGHLSLRLTSVGRPTNRGQKSSKDLQSRRLRNSKEKTSKKRKNLSSRRKTKSCGNKCMELRVRNKMKSLRLTLGLWTGMRGSE